ncbi:hypothetical protein RUM43_001884 [Polyplax serrata]|uniref:Uncharacterized protein n=1 Tax=Polyplax serrata TaxID=468196 RepID=A0AAN8SG67_POLSC
MLVGVRGIKERLRKRVMWCPGPGGIKLRKSWVTTHHVTFIFFFFGWYPPRIVRASVVRTGPVHIGGTPGGRVPGSRRRRNSRNLRGRHVGIQTRPVKRDSRLRNSDVMEDEEDQSRRERERERERERGERKEDEELDDNASKFFNFAK